MIKSFQIDSTSVLQGKRRLSTNEPNETVLLLASAEDSQPIVSAPFDEKKTRHAYWQPIDKHYRTSPTTTTTTTPPDTTYMIVKQTPTPLPPPSSSSSFPGQRCYKTNSLDQTTDNGIVIVERCQLRAQSVDTNPTVSRRNLQTIVEAIRHLEGDDALANINPSSQTTSLNQERQQGEDLPAQIKAMINEKFQTINNTNKNPSINTHLYQQGSSFDIDLHQRPPKKRKITYNETEDNPLDRSGRIIRCSIV